MGITQSTTMALKLLVLVALAAYKCDALPTATDLVVPEANTISSDQKQTTFYEKQTTYDIVDDNAQTDQTGDRLLEVEGGCTNTPNWHDADGATYDCAWYSQGSNCASYGNSYAGVAGQTANQACCACQTSGSEAQTPTPQPWQQPAPACPATCHGGQTCDSVISSMPSYFTCPDLEAYSGCDCAGCTCSTPWTPPTPQPTEAPTEAPASGHGSGHGSGSGFGEGSGSQASIPPPVCHIYIAGHQHATDNVIDTGRGIHLHATPVVHVRGDCLSVVIYDKYWHDNDFNTGPIHSQNWRAIPLPSPIRYRGGAGYRIYAGY